MYAVWIRTRPNDEVCIPIKVKQKSTRYKLRCLQIMNTFHYHYSVIVFMRFRIPFILFSYRSKFSFIIQQTVILSCNKSFHYIAKCGLLNQIISNNTTNKNEANLGRVWICVSKPHWTFGGNERQNCGKAKRWNQYVLLAMVTFASPAQALTSGELSACLTAYTIS